VSTGSIYVKLNKYTVNRRIYRNTNANPIPALVEKFTTQLFYAQSTPIPNPIPNHNPIANPIPNPALVELNRRLTEID